MRHKYPIVTLCGSTRFKDEFYQIQKDLSLQGMIVISVGLFGHAGDEEVWEGMNENTKTRTKQMLDDMHKEKIDMADEIFVVNPGGYVGTSTWSEICYARMTGKSIKSLYPIDMIEIDIKVREHIKEAEILAWQQMDYISHVDPYYDKNEMTYFVHKKEEIFDPWFCQDAAMVEGSELPCHGNERNGFDPFKIYGKEKIAHFVEDILMHHEADSSTSAISEDRQKLLDEVDFYCRELGISYPDGYPNNVSNDELQDFIDSWSEYDPVPELK